MLLDVMTRNDLDGELLSMFSENPWMFEQILRDFLKHRYNISLESFDKVIQETIPEEIL